MVIHTPRKLGRASLSRLVGFLLLVMAGTAQGGELIRLFGEENVGTAGGQFLRIPVGARAIALGKAYSACAIDGSAAFWYPA